MLASAVIAATLGAVCAGTIEAAEPSLTDVLTPALRDVLDPRFIFLSNVSSSTLNSIFSGLAVVLVLGLGIVLLLFALGFFDGDAIFSRYDPYHQQQQHHDLYSSYSAYNPDVALPQPQHGFQARSLSSAQDIISVMKLLDEAFQKLEVEEMGCQQLVVCEAHQKDAGLAYGPEAGKIQAALRSADDRSLEKIANTKAAATFGTFRAAALRGAQGQDCAAAYGTGCTRGLRKKLRTASGQL